MTDKSSDESSHDTGVSITNEGPQDVPDVPAQTPQSLDGGVTYTWLKELTSRMSSLEVNVKSSQEDSSKVRAEAAGVSDAYMSRTMPEVRDCNWEQFKNRFPGETGIYTIEVLLASGTLDEEMEIEQLKRLTPEKKLEVLAARRKSKRAQHRDNGPRRLERVRINSAFVLAILARVTGETWAGKPHTFLRPFKTLIHYHEKMEAEYLKLQEDLCTEGEKTRTTETQESTGQGEKNITIAETASTKFSANTSSMKEESGGTPPNIALEPLASMRNNKKDVSNSGTPAAGGVKELRQETAVLSREVIQKALEDMACYIDFVRTQLIPVYKMFDDFDFRKPKKVRYQDLWSLFRVGELVILRSTDKSDSRTGGGEAKSVGNQKTEDAPHTVNTEPLVGRIFWIQADVPEWDVDDLSETGRGGRLRRDEDPDDSDSDDEENTLLGFYYIDHDGEGYRAVHNWSHINHFSGEMDVTQLPFIPLRFVKDHEQILQELQTRGEKFQSIVGHSARSNLSYKGWTLTRSPLDGPLWKDEQRRMTLGSSVYVDSDIIVDFREAYQSHPGWKPHFGMFKKDDYIAQTSEDKFTIIRWSDKDRTEAVYRESEVVIYNDAIHNRECDQLLDTFEGRHLMDPETLAPHQITTGGVLPKEDLIMLPSRLFAYALRERKFVNTNLRYISQNPQPDPSNTFDKLKISDKHKLLIQSVVLEHFEKKAAQKQGNTKDLEISDQDFIRGKGRGLVILLHGAPGVGKTATAEAVSYAYNKPLFPITCGNLGIEPAAVENSLKELFRLASLWDCILLLDEAEIFLSPRTKTDDNLQRNALVSVFLRVLEYYSGVLFLTTNRSGALDEAVKSRVHLSLLYPHLGRTETLALFDMNIKRLAQIERETAQITGQQELTIEENGIMDFAERHFYKFERMEDSRWNGRQIRNAFQIAASLARYQKKQDLQRGHYVGADHFQKVEDATLDYDKFRERTAKQKESEIAWKKGDRGPDFAPAQSARPGWRSSQRHSPDHARHDATTSPPFNRAWESSPNVHSDSRGGGVARDNRGDHGGGSAWSQGGGLSTLPPRQAQRPSPSPYVSHSGDDGGGGHGRDQSYMGRSPEAGGYHPGDDQYN